ncbi:MAG: Na+:solute symporter [Bacteroidales bacterium]|nr:Na+:solute symporter [Bacteroidales bacterium]
MIIKNIDLIIIALYFVASLSIGLYMSKRAGQNTGNFFLSGRNLPWWIAGTSMVATTFAADTPLAVTELVSQQGVAGNWLWWNMMFGGMLTVFFFARLWRRAGIVTDAEFVAIRYSGKAARFLRGFRAVYIGIFMNVIVMAWVNLAMVKIVHIMFPFLTIFGHKAFHILGMDFSASLVVVAGLMLFTALYSSLSGLMGVALTDSFQFLMAMAGSIILAIVAVHHVGGISGMESSLHQMKWVFNFFPTLDHGTAAGHVGGMLKLGVTAIVAYFGVQWWASWYPGAEPGGGGYVAQRMMSAKNEKHSLLATLWFQIAHFALRPWPWILVALATLIMYPTAADKGATYVMAIRDLLPSGLLGLMLAAFLAAYMSTIASQTVWGTSYIINDLFKPFVKPGASEKYYVRISRVTTFVLMFFSVLVTTQFNQISDAWKFILACSGGIGLVLLLRWFWWRINAWSEISAMLAPYAVYPILKYHGVSFESSLIVIVAWSTLVWLVVTFLTKPTSDEKLTSFYQRIHPGGKGWKRIAAQNPQVKGDTGYTRLFVNWLLGVILVSFSLFGFGKIIFHDYVMGLELFGVALISGVLMFRNMNKMGWEKIVE